MILAGEPEDYSYAWPNGETSSSTNLPAGTYEVSAEDENGCALTESFAISAPDAIVLQIDNQINNACQGDENGSATLSSQGGTGNINFLWPSGATGPTDQNLASGDHVVIASDEKVVNNLSP